MSILDNEGHNPDGLGNRPTWDNRPGINAVVEKLQAENVRLRGLANSIGVCSCEPGMCDTKFDLQCRAREALTGINNDA